MALNFPSSPIDGQIYTDSVSGNRYVYNAANTAWLYSSNTTGGASITGTSNTQVLFNYQDQISGSNGLLFLSNTLFANTVSIQNTIASINSINFITTNQTATAPNDGEIQWNPDEQTLDIGLANGAILQSGQEVLYYVKNQTGATILEGTVVGSVGTLGSSGRILVAPFRANNQYESKYCIGVTTTEILNGGDGFVTHFGKVRGLDTSMYSQGQILYANATSAGSFATSMPSAPNNKITLAIVIHSDVNGGIIFVRPTIGSRINEDELAEITSIANGDLLFYNTNPGRFENNPQAAVNAGRLNGITANTIFAHANNTANAANLWSNTVAGYANTWANTKLSNTSGVSFAGDLYFPTGKIGIGTSTPDATLVINGDGQNTAALTTNTKLGGALVLSDNGTAHASGSGGVLIFGGTGSGGNLGRFAAIKGLLNNSTSNSTGDLAFSIRNAVADATLTEIMRITYTGNVGIGTSSPGYKLDVAGSANISQPTLIVGGSNVLAAISAGNTYTQTVAGYSNTWSNTVAGYSNTWANTTQGNAQAYANSVGTAANNQAGLMANASNSASTTRDGYSNNWANTVAGYANSWANTQYGNSLTYANAVGTGANNQAGLMANAANSSAAATYLPLAGGTITGSLVINQNLTVSGTTTYVNTQSLLIGDSVIVLNADLPSTAVPTENAGIEVNRGNTNSNSAIVWVESAQKWYITSNTWAGNNNWIASNADLIVLGTGANNQAGLMANAANAYSQSLEGVGNNWANTVAGISNNWANTVAGYANTWANTKVASVTGTAGQIFSSGGTTPTINLISTGVSATTYGGSTQIPAIVVDAFGRITSASNAAVQGMDYAYANAVGTGANNQAGLMANASNSASTTRDGYSNNWANTVAGYANNWANTKLSNTSGVSFAGDLYFPTGNVTIGGTTTNYKLQVYGSFAANTKSFVIDHPTKEGMKLRHGSLEGPENGVYVRGKCEGSFEIDLPDYWTGLIDADSITVTLTPYGRKQNLFVRNIANNKVFIYNSDDTLPYCYYLIQAERKDVEKLVVEY